MEAEQIVSLLRRIRHEYGNDLQVIGGYIDLNRLEQAREYIHAVVEQHNQEPLCFSIACRLKPALYFYQQALSCRDLGVILRYKTAGWIPMPFLKKGRSPIKASKDWLKRTLSFGQGALHLRQHHCPKRQRPDGVLRRTPGQGSPGAGRGVTLCL